MEVYKLKLYILYSPWISSIFRMSNFLPDQTWSEKIFEHLARRLKKLGVYVIRIQRMELRTRFSLDRVSSKYSTRIRDPRNNECAQLDELI